MAPEWIKIEKTTCRKPEILRIAARLSIHPDHALGLVVRWFAWCDDQLQNPHADGVSILTINYAFGTQGFAEALIDCGWLKETKTGVEIPNFERHMSQSAKRRAVNAERQKQAYDRQREKPHDDSVRNRTEKAHLEEEKEKEKEKNNPPTPLGGSVFIRSIVAELNLPDWMNGEAFQKAWDELLTYRSERKLASYKTSTIKTQFKRFSEWGEEDTLQALRDSIANAWQGIFQPKGNNGTAQQGRPGHKPIHRIHDETKNWDAIPRIVADSSGDAEPDDPDAAGPFG